MRVSGTTSVDRSRPGLKRSPSGASIGPGGTRASWATALEGRSGTRFSAIASEASFPALFTAVLDPGPPARTV
jgi:hypothetical protein